ncbi:MAG: aminoacyl-tRNA hydrolase [Candidatus Paceibacterota bacterium]
MYNVVGLGNPDEKYTGTRHNVGRMLVQQFAADFSFPEWKNDKNARARVTSGEVEHCPVKLLLPETFMNHSGETVTYIHKKYEAEISKIIVVFDDINLPIGTLRISHNRGDGGHNGIRSIIAGLGSKEFIQIRIGIAPVSFWTGAIKRPQGGVQISQFVLGYFSRGEQTKIEKIKPNVFAAFTTIISVGVEKAMNTYN